MEASLQKWTDSTTLMTQRSNAIWVVAYGIEKFYLTDAEKDYLLTSLEKGAKFVQIKGNVLTDKFMYIVRDIDEVKHTPINTVSQLDKYADSTPEQQEKMQEVRTRVRAELKEKGILKK